MSYRLYREPEHGIVAGVCAGIADYFGLPRNLLRLGVLVALVLFFPFTLLSYLGLALVLRPRPPGLYRTPEDEAFWRGVATAPDRTLGGLRAKFRELEERLRGLEDAVTDRDFELRRQFRDLGR